jgi:hypothetical protein
MTVGKSLALASLAAAAALAGPAQAKIIALTNASFETVGPIGLVNDCTFGCVYSDDRTPIVGWTAGGGAVGAGQLQPGGVVPFFKFIPDGITVAYLNAGPNGGGNGGETISQTAPGVSKANTEYALSVSFGYNKSILSTGVMELTIGSSTQIEPFATGKLGFTGDWERKRIVVTPKPGDVGEPIVIKLSSFDANSVAYFDQVRLVSKPAAARLPEPGVWGLMLMGFAGVGLTVRRRRATA